MLDVEVEELPGGVEQHGDHDAGHEGEAQALLRGGAGDHVPPQQVTRQRLNIYGWNLNCRVKLFF